MKLIEILKADDDSNYERSESIRLLAIEDYDQESEEELLTFIKLKYNTDWCNCTHDCCGHWKATVSSIKLDRIYRRVMVYINYTQNI